MAAFVPPLLFVVFFAAQSGSLQNNDYYHSIIQAIDPDPGSWIDRVHELLSTRSNEHRIGVPMLIYLGNYHLFDGDNRSLVVVTLLMMLLVGWVQVRLAEPVMDRYGLSRHGLGLRWAVALVIAAFAFTPVAAHNVAMAFSGTMWFMSNCFFVLGLLALVRGAAGNLRGATVLVVLCGLGGLFSYSTSLAYWPSLLLAGLLLRVPRRKLLVIAAAAIASYVYYFGTRTFSATEPNTSDGALLVKFFASYMGSSFSWQVDGAAILGGAGLVVAALSVVACIRLRVSRARLAPWFAMQLYGLLNGIGTAVGRSTMREDMAVSSRYATIPAFFWVGLFIVLLHIAARLPKHERRSTWVIVAVYLVLVASAVPRGLELWRDFIVRADRQNVAELALLSGVHDDEVLSSVSPWPVNVWITRPIMERLEHVPFNRAVQGPELGTRIDPAAISVCPSVQGRATGRKRLNDGTLRVEGRAAVDQAKPVDQVLVLDPDGRIAGRIVVGQPTPGAGNARWGGGSRFFGWTGYVLERPDLVFRDLQFVVPDGGGEGWCRLKSSVDSSDAQRLPSGTANQRSLTDKA